MTPLLYPIFPATAGHPIFSAFILHFPLRGRVRGSVRAPHSIFQLEPGPSQPSHAHRLPKFPRLQTPITPLPYQRFGTYSPLPPLPSFPELYSPLFFFFPSNVAFPPYRQSSCRFPHVFRFCQTTLRVVQIHSIPPIFPQSLLIPVVCVPTFFSPRELSINYPSIGEGVTSSRWFFFLFLFLVQPIHSQSL